jgi:hypothetical protein
MLKANSLAAVLAITMAMMAVVAALPLLTQLAMEVR